MAESYVVAAVLRQQAYPLAYGTTAVGADSAVAEPTAFVAVTANRSREPASPAPTPYVGPVAFVTFTHAKPPGSQRCHWYAKLVGEPAQVPVEPVSV
jgi:hypothetical protein